MLKQLSGMDTMFLYAESHRAPLELGCLQVYDPSTAPSGKVRFKEILATFQERLDRCDVFRQKLVEVPLSLDHPYWVLDEEFDLEYHVRHISLPKPGDWPQLMAQIARLQARQLDHSRPLWMAHIIEGLDNVPGVAPGSFAMYLKIHHSAIDGATGQSVQAALHDAEPQQVDASDYRPTEGSQGDSDPGSWNLLLRTPLNTAIKSSKLGFGIVRAIPGAVKAAIAARKADRDPVPSTVFNEGRVSPNRVIGGCFFPLDDFKRIRATREGVTVNDVALAVVGGALRYYLDAKDALPGVSLLAGCPINVGTEEDAESGRGNLLSMMTPPLHTEIEDPMDRLVAIHDGTEEAKAWVETLGSDTLTQIPMNLPAPFAKSLFPLFQQVALRAESVPYNTMITNVAGIQRPVYLAGAEMVRILATGPVIDRSGLFHTAFSYNGTVSIGFTACREMLLDPEFYTECIEASYADLKRAALGDKPAATKKKAGKRKKAAKKVSRDTRRKVASKTNGKTTGLNP